MSKIAKVIDFGGKTAKVVAGLGISIAIAAATEMVTDKATVMNGNYIESKVKYAKRLFKVK